MLTTMTKMFIAMLKKFEKLCVIKTHLVFAIFMLMILCGYIMKYRYIIRSCNNSSQLIMKNKILHTHVIRRKKFYIISTSIIVY